jgi:hypothetical protein
MPLRFWLPKCLIRDVNLSGKATCEVEQESCMRENHLHPHRAWVLIRDRGELTANEVDHLESCRGCNDWLITFVSQARKSGFHISFEIPLYQLLQPTKAA